MTQPGPDTDATPQPYAPFQLSTAHVLARTQGHLWAESGFRELMDLTQRGEIEALSRRFLIGTDASQHVLAPEFGTGDEHDALMHDDPAQGLGWAVYPDGSAHIRVYSAQFGLTGQELRAEVAAAEEVMLQGRHLTVTWETARTGVRTYGVKEVERLRELITPLIGFEHADKALQDAHAWGLRQDRDYADELNVEIVQRFAWMPRQDRHQHAARLAAYFARISAETLYTE